MFFSEVQSEYTVNVHGWVFCCLLGDSSLQFPADKETNKTEKSDSVDVLPASTAVKDKKATDVSRCNKLTVSACTVMQ